VKHNKKREDEREREKVKNEEEKKHCHVPVNSVAESTQKPEAVSRG